MERLSEKEMHHKQHNKTLHYPKMNRFISYKNKFQQWLIKLIGQMLRSQKTHQEVNIYKNKIYQPVKETEQYELKVCGEIPKQLNGLLLRIGSNPIHVTQPRLFDWYLGDGMLHALELQNGQALSFKSTLLATDQVQYIKAQAQIEGFRRGAHDVVNTNIFAHAGLLWAVIEAGAFPICLDKQLNSLRYQLFNSDANLPFTAHPRKDRQTGHLHAICYDALKCKNAYYEVIDEEGQLIHFTEIELAHAPMIHDCLLTEKEIIVFDGSITFSVKHLLQGYSVPYTWNPKKMMRIGILPKYANAEQIVWIELEPCFVFHAANAYRADQEQIIIDVLVHHTDFRHTQHAAYESQHAQLERWSIDLATQQLHRELLDSQVQEFPKIDERFTGIFYRYLYTLKFRHSEAFNQMCIHDLLLKRSIHYDFGLGWGVGEVTFTPETVESAEGCGYLMAYVHRLDGGAAKVAILKVDGLEIQLQAEIDLGVHIPLGFHCNWVNDFELSD